MTYVPARNTVFLSIALGYGEVIGATHLFIGANAVDYSGYPDCRPEFIEQFERLANVATAAVDGGARWVVEAPLMKMSKSDIVRTGTALGVDYSLTVSCYQADDNGTACGACDACRLRHKGFLDAGLQDPTPIRWAFLQKSKKIPEVTCQIRLGRYHTRPIGLTLILDVGR